MDQISKLRTASLEAYNYDIVLWTLTIISLLVLVVFLRKKYLQQVEITAIDLSIAIFPFLIWLVLSGKLTEVKIGDVSFKTSIVQAQSKKITPATINALDVQHTPVALKGDIDEIDQIIKDQKEALVFQLRYDNYSTPIIEKYFRGLLTSTLKYVVFENLDGSFAGIIYFPTLANQLFKGDGMNIRWFNDVIRKGDANNLKILKGFVSSQFSVSYNDTRADALNKAIKTNSEFLPVVNDNRFSGIVTQSRINSLILFDLYTQSNKNSN